MQRSSKRPRESSSRAPNHQRSQDTGSSSTSSSTSDEPSNGCSELETRAQELILETEETLVRNAEPNPWNIQVTKGLRPGELYVTTPPYPAYVRVRVDVEVDKTTWKVDCGGEPPVRKEKP